MNVTEKIEKQETKEKSTGKQQDRWGSNGKGTKEAVKNERQETRIIETNKGLSFAVKVR